MAKKEELGKLSPEQLKKLGKVISEAKDLTSQQAEIIEKVLAGEEEIGERRISYLEEYFDTYSKKLDQIARKHSRLNDAFLVLDSKLTKSYRALASDVAKLEKQLKDLANGTATINSNTDGTKHDKKADSDAKSTSGNTAIQDILRALDGGIKLDKNQFKEILAKTRSALSSIKLDKTQYQTLLAKLGDVLIEPMVPDTNEAAQLAPEVSQPAVPQITQIIQEAPKQVAAQNVQRNIEMSRPAAATEALHTTAQEAHAPMAAQETQPIVQVVSNDGKRSATDTQNKDADTNLTAYKLLQELCNISTAAVNALAKYSTDLTSGLMEAMTEREPVDNSGAAARSKNEPGSGQTASNDGQPPSVPPIEPPKPSSVVVENTVSEQEIASLRETEKTAKDFLGFLDGIATDGIAIYTQEAKVKKRQLERNKALIESWAKKEEAIRTSMLELAIAKLQTQEELENRSIEIRLSRLQEATDAELKAQQLLNQIDLQLAKSPDKRAVSDQEAGDARARKTNADLNIKAYQELEKQLADKRAELDLKTRLKTGKELTAKQAAANEKEARKYIAARKDAIIKETRERLLAEQQLANFKANDSALAAKRDAEVAKRVAALELKYRQENNNELTKAAREAAIKQAEEEYAIGSANMSKLAEELRKQGEIDLFKEVDPALAAKREEEMAKYKADLEYEFMLANNGKLTEAAIESIKQQVETKYALESDAMNDLAEQRLNSDKFSRFKENNQAGAAAFEKKKAQDTLTEEIKLRKKYSGEELTKRLKDLKKAKDEEYVLDEKNQKKLEKIQLEADKKEKRAGIAETDSRIAHDVQLGGFSKEDNFADRMVDLWRIARDAGDGNVGKTIGASLLVATKAISSLVQQLEGTIDKIGSYKGGIDTRMQGSSNKKRMGSYWDQLTTDMMSVGAVTPYFKQEDFANNIKSLVEKGISFDLKQRAFLMTIQEKIANTFNVADGTLLRLIRIQQEDSTAGRLGMESALNSFLNNMYETSEYLTDVAASVRGSLEEMESLMKGAEATEVEFQVQKWMGSLYSVGMSQNAVTTIANALGQIASGQVDALTGNGAGNLLVMAANEAGLSIAEILAEGLDAKNTNKLLQATVNYLAEIAESSKGNNVVQQQLATVFGVKASDLKAAVNLAEPGSTNDIFGKNLTYGNMIKQLNDMANSMILRTSVGEFMTNVWDNAQYSIASSMANNPITYLTYKLAGLLDDAVGGIDLPFVNVMGFGVDLNTTVADLMRVASVTGGILGSLGPMVSGLASSFSGQAMLSKMGIGKGSGLEVNHRGSGDGAASAANSGGGAQSTSGSGYVGQSNGNDVKNATIQEAEDSKKKQMIKAKEEEPANQVDVLNGTVLKIYELLDSVTKGDRTIRVRVDSYGLTGTGHTNTSLNGSNSILGNGGNSATGGGFDDGSASGNSGAGGSVGGGGYGGAYGETSGSSGSISSGGSAGSGYEGSGSSSGSGSPIGSGGRFDLGGWTIS